MSIYSMGKLINETRKLAAEFKRSTGTMLPVSGEIARYDVSKNLHLTLNNNHDCGFDAIGTNLIEGQRVQIKSRVIGDGLKSNHRLGQMNTNGRWDIVILSLMNNNFEPIEMYQATHEDIVNALSNTRTNGKKQKVLSVAKFKNIGELVWSHKLNMQATH